MRHGSSRGHREGRRGRGGSASRGARGRRRPARGSPGWLLKWTVVFFAIVISLNLSPPLVHAQDHGVDGSADGALSPDYGIFSDLESLQADKEAYLDSPQIAQETREALDFQVEETPVPAPSTDYTSRELPVPHPLNETPYIFGAVERYPSVGGNNDIIDWLAAQPLNYYVHTRYGPHDTWQKGLLRPSLALPKFDLQPDWGWNYLDADHNTATGVGGIDLRVRMRQSIKDVTVNLGLLDTGLTLKGGFVMEIERLHNETGVMPIEVAILKSVSYEGLNYIILGR